MADDEVIEHDQKADGPDRRERLLNLLAALDRDPRRAHA